MVSWRFSRCSLPILCLVSITVAAQTSSVVRDGDIALDCRSIRSEKEGLQRTVDAGVREPSEVQNDPKGGTSAGGPPPVASGSSGMGILGGLGSLFGKPAGTASPASGAAAPQESAADKVRLARGRIEFLDRLGRAKGCRADDDSFAGTPLSQAEFASLASAAGGTTQLLTVDAVDKALAQPLEPLAQPLNFEGELKLAGKRFYLAEFRVLYEVSGAVTASTRAGRLPGVSYGATHSSIKYQVPRVDVAALQAITDKAHADFLQRLQAAGIALEPATAFVAQHGAVYPATEPASTAEAPVYEEQDLGYTKRKYMVFAPSGMKLHPRSFAGLGAGNIGTRIDYVKNKLEALTVGVVVNFAALESSGSGSSILNQDGASTAARPEMSLTAPAGYVVAQGHADAGMLRMPKATVIPGSFAVMREVGGYDTQSDAAVRGLQMLSSLMGVAASKSKTVEMAMELDGPATSRLILQGLQAFNQQLVDVMRNR